MTARLLVTNGCSFTWGDELANRQDAWPVVLAAALDVPVVNLAACGGSNRRLVRTSVEVLSSLCDENRLAPGEVLFLGMWTSLERTERFDPDEADPVGRSPAVPDDEYWRRILPWAARRRDRAAKAYYRHMYSERGALESFLLDWILLQGFLAHCGYNFGFLLARPTMPATLPERLVPQLDQTRTLGGTTLLNEHSMLSTTYGSHPYGPRKHPLAAAHRHFAESIIAPWATRLAASGRQ